MELDFKSTPMEHRLSSFIPYPTGRLRRLARLPIYLYRLGLGSLASIWPIMILTTRGRKTGKPRYAALEYRRHGSKFYVVSLWGTQPQWYKNLLADPRATVQVGRRIFGVRAAKVDNAAEAARVLYMFHRTAPVIYDPLLMRMSAADSIDLTTLGEVSGKFTIMRLDAVPETPTLPVVRSDWGWLVPLVGLGLMLTLVFALVRSRRSD